MFPTTPNPRIAKLTITQAPVLYPSFYIELEKRSLNPHSCRMKDTEVEFTNGVPRTKLYFSKQKSPDPDDDNWNPFTNYNLDMSMEEEKEVLIFPDDINYGADRVMELTSFAA
jgi:hypothetical protein